MIKTLRQFTSFIFQWILNMHLKLKVLKHLCIVRVLCHLHGKHYFDKWNIYNTMKVWTHKYIPHYRSASRMLDKIRNKISPNNNRLWSSCQEYLSYIIICSWYLHRETAKVQRAHTTNGEICCLKNYQTACLAMCCSGGLK